MRVAALFFAVIVAAGCGGESSSAPAGGSGTRTAIDESARVQYELTGTHLRVEVLPDAPRFEDLFLGRGAFTFRCGTDPYGSISDSEAEGAAEFDPSSRTADVELSADVSEDVILCAAEAPGGAQESTAWFVDPEELYGFHQPTEEEQAANEARAKAATDCVAFINEIYEEFGLKRDKGKVQPGTPPTVPVQAYWFGPQLDDRRATYAESLINVDINGNGEKFKVPMYLVMYQRPEDGCQGQALNLSSDEDFGFGVGHEIQMFSMPVDSYTAQTFLNDPNDPEALGLASSYQTRLANGEPATVYFAGGLDGLAVLTESTLIELIGGGYGNEKASRRVVPLLRPIGE
jgi:hypothetical protein